MRYFSCARCDKRISYAEGYRATNWKYNMNICAKCAMVEKLKIPDLKIRKFKDAWNYEEYEF